MSWDLCERYVQIFTLMPQNMHSTSQHANPKTHKQISAYTHVCTDKTRNIYIYMNFINHKNPQHLAEELKQTDLPAACPQLHLSSLLASWCSPAIMSWDLCERYVQIFTLMPQNMHSTSQHANPKTHKQISAYTHVCTDKTRNIYIYEFYKPQKPTTPGGRIEAN